MNILSKFWSSFFEEKKPRPSYLMNKVLSLPHLLDADGTGSNHEEHDLLVKAFQSGFCPDCGIWEMYEGPSGGMSVNMACGNCGGEFNHSGFTTDRIHSSRATQQNEVDVNPQIIKNWKKFDFFRSSSKMQSVREWCAENCNDQWASNRFFIYIKDDADATAFKIMWPG